MPAVSFGLVSVPSDYDNLCGFDLHFFLKSADGRFLAPSGQARDPLDPFLLQLYLSFVVDGARLVSLIVGKLVLLHGGSPRVLLPLVKFLLLFDVLLGVGADLGPCARSYMPLNALPVLAVHLDRLDKAVFLLLPPSARFRRLRPGLSL